MTRTGAVALLLALLTGPAAAQDEAAFVAACALRGGTAEVCECKAKAASKLLDKRLHELVILSMAEPDAFTARAKTGEVTDADQARWNVYIQDSNRACGLNY